MKVQISARMRQIPWNLLVATTKPAQSGQRGLRCLLVQRHAETASGQDRGLALVESLV